MEKRTDPQTRSSLLYQQARRYHQMGDLGEAVTLYGKVLAARPRHTPSLLHLGEIAWQTGNLDQASVLLARALTLDPQYVEAYDLFWQVRKAQGDYEAAVGILRRLIEIRRHEGFNYYHLALLQQERGYLEEAGSLFEQAIRYKPDDARIFFAYGELLQAQGRIDAAAGKLQQALLHDPRNALYHAKFAWLQAFCGQTQESLIHIERAILLDPGNETYQSHRWQIQLKMGLLAEGFAAAERRSNLKTYQKDVAIYAGIAQWNGKPFSGRLLIYPETELADILQYARYFPQVKALGGTVILALPKPLMKLFANLYCIDEIVEATSAGVAISRADSKVSIASLPFLFDTSLESIPAHVPYLFADPFLTHSWVRRLDWKSFRVGLVWSTAAQSIPFSSSEQLMKLPGISWYGLQMDGTENKAPAGLTLPVVDCSGGLRDYADMAALAANLDLVIAVDSPQAHLAAAIGRPVWTLLPFESDWRWLHRREDSPWYPTMRLFRQSQPGDWDGVVRRVADALGPKSRPFRQFQPLQGKPREFFADSAVTYSC